MNKYLLTLTGILIILSMNLALGQASHYGDKIDASNAINTDELISKMGESKELETKVEGKIVKVCQVKGCWMTMELPDGETMRVTFKDYAYFVPKDVGGKMAVVQGKASVEVTSVDELRHYAEDEGLSKEEIAGITEPKKEITFEASGVIIQ